MALEKSIDFKGLTVPKAYYKIVRSQAMEAPQVEGEDKSYVVIVDVNEFTDSTKENILSNDRHKFTVSKEEDLNITNYYSLLKELEKFADSTDV